MQVITNRSMSSYPFWAIYGTRLGAREGEGETIWSGLRLPRHREKLFCAQVCLLSRPCLSLQGSSPAPQELHHDAQTSLAFTSHPSALCRRWNSPLAQQQWCCCREAPPRLLLQEQLLLLWVNLHRTGPLAEVLTYKGAIKTTQDTSLVHTLTFLWVSALQQRN